VRIYNEDHDTLLSGILNPATQTRYETNFVNSAAENRFFYYGAGWSSTSGTAARLYSGSNYDRNLNVIGASVVFQTNGADAIALYRDTRAGYAPVEVCSILVSDRTERRCVNVPNDGGTGISQPFGVLLNTTNNTTPHLVTITTTGYGTLILDAIEVYNTNAPLTAGMYEEFHPALLYSETLAANGVNVNSQWTPIYSSTYSGGRMMQTTALPPLVDHDSNPSTPPIPNTVDGSLVFEFSGTGFEIGTLVDRYGGEVLVCYEAGTLPVNPLDINQFCYRYQNESSTVRATVSRSVAGLDNGTYSVRIQNVSDAFSNLTTTPVARLAAYTPARLRVDYVRIFNPTPPTVTIPGWYNENATDGAGAQFLQLLPAERWARFTGTAAAAFTNQSYYSVVGTTPTVVSTVYAGPLATLRVQASASGTTVILYTGAATTTNSDLILVCAENVTDDAPPPPANECVTRNIRTANQIVVSNTDLAALGVAGPVDLTFRALNAGGFKIDGFQLIHGSTLTAGIYDNILAGTPVLTFGTDTTPGGANESNYPTNWTTANHASHYNGSVTQTSTRNARLTFNFTGTGFSVVTFNDPNSVDMRICYVSGGAGFDGVFDEADETCEFIGAVSAPIVGTNPNIESFMMSGQIIYTATGTAPNLDFAEIRGVIAANTRVRVLTTFGDPDGAGPKAAGPIAREVWVVPTTASYRYGYAYYGLPNGAYSVEVRHIDTTTTATQFMRIDAVAVFGNVPAPIAPGLYDDAAAAITFAPEPFWTVTTNAVYSPPRGPYNRTEHTATNYGSVAQMNVNGNGLILYQTARSVGSRNVRICLVVPGQPNDCSDFSQNSAAARYFTPIAFFGFGPGSHEVIVEQRNHGTSNNLSVDGVRVLP
jgi:hypothetical protein